MIRYIPPSTERWIDEEGCRGITHHEGRWHIDWLPATAVLLLGLCAITGILSMVVK